ncbi:MAG TPA: serine protease [Ruminococcaceae bacterium]|jgi:segregation and condensation protein A|nr:serine protease [Oscillospiraceae bacterium]HBQ47067.1 serine protease [Oscillospiraceae bacterium]HBT90980.1 serine protease [Oscillospiraceae bacterium]HCB91451.1 serine protease [Oscillospiraceae bacterium]
MEKLNYKLNGFEGPLDLLLHLIAKNKMNICDICIADLVDQYLEQIHAMQKQDMDVASEFLEMAAKLVYIKTASLLPKPEEAERMSRELSGRLLEYDQCRRAAAELGRRFSFDFLTRPAEQVEFDTSYRGHHTPREIYEAYRSAVGRGRRFLPPPAEAFSGIVAHKIVSVASCIKKVLHGLRGAGRARFLDLYRGCRGRSELVATFLAVLELVKGGRIRVEGRDDTVILKDGGVADGR